MEKETDKGKEAVLDAKNKEKRKEKVKSGGNVYTWDTSVAVTTSDGGMKTKTARQNDGNERGQADHDEFDLASYSSKVKLHTLH